MKCGKSRIALAPVGLLRGLISFAKAYDHLAKLRDALLGEPALVGLRFVDDSSELVQPAGHVVTGELLVQESCQLAHPLDGTEVGLQVLSPASSKTCIRVPLLHRYDERILAGYRECRQT